MASVGFRLSTKFTASHFKSGQKGEEAAAELKRPESLSSYGCWARRWGHGSRVHRLYRSPRATFRGWIWTAIPGGAQNRVGLGADWKSDDLARLSARWPSLSDRARARRGAALLRSIEADWDRLQPTAGADAVYYYRTWTTLRPAASTWVGRLRQLPFLRSGAGGLERPVDVVIDTTRNRLIMGGTNGVLGSRPSRVEALMALGVRQRPDVEMVIQRLSEVRAVDAETSPKDVLAIARACYETLAEHLREQPAPRENSDLGERLRSRFQGRAAQGLIYAPPPEEVQGQRWWSPRKVIHANAARWVGPYIGQLAGRYKAAALLWETLAIPRDLTAEMASGVIARDLTTDADHERALTYYGRIVAFLEDQARVGPPMPQTPAFTTSGWRPGNETWWSGREWIRDSFAVDVPWWQPYDRDPSSHRRAAAYLGIREVTGHSSGGPLKARWQLGDLEQLELNPEARWSLAVQCWPRLLRQDSEPVYWSAIDELAQRITDLKPAISPQLRVRLTFQNADASYRSTIQPPVILYEAKSLVIGRSAESLFSMHAAAEIASLASINQRTWGRHLAFLLKMAEHEPQGLDEIAARYAVVGYQHREFTFNPDDIEDQIDDAAATRVPPRAKRPTPKKDGRAKTSTLADPNRYTLKDIRAGNPGAATAGATGGVRLSLNPPMNCCVVGVLK